MKNHRTHGPLIPSIFIIATLLLVSSFAYYQGIAVGAQSAPNFVATAVSGPVSVSNPGHEAFWGNIPGTDVPLTTTGEFGGATKSVTLKFANNGTHLIVFARWTDTTESRTKNNVIEDEGYAGLFKANSTFAYEDRIVIWWSLDSTVGPPPCMQKAAAGHGEGESIAGTGNLWHWKAARTDSSGTSYGKMTYGSGPFSGNPLVPAHSYADNEFINRTGHYQLGFDQYPSNFTIGYAENDIPYNTFVVSAHGVYDSSEHSYTWVATRALTTTPAGHDLQFQQGKTYNFAVAVYDGGPIPIPSTMSHPTGWTSYGENEETKSISSWNTMALGAPAGGSTSTVTTTAGGPAATSGVLDFGTAAVIGLALLVAGLAAGVLVASKVLSPKRS